MMEYDVSNEVIHIFPLLVYVRIRPLSNKELSNGEKVIVHVKDHVVCFVLSLAYT